LTWSFWCQAPSHFSPYSRNTPSLNGNRFFSPFPCRQLPLRRLSWWTMSAVTPCNKLFAFDFAWSSISHSSDHWLKHPPSRWRACRVPEFFPSGTACSLPVTLPTLISHQDSFPAVAFFFTFFPIVDHLQSSAPLLPFFLYRLFYRIRHVLFISEYLFSSFFQHDRGLTFLCQLCVPLNLGRQTEPKTG